MRSKRYFTVSRSAVEMFSAHIWKTILKKSFVVFSLFYLHFCFGLLICIGGCKFKSCRVLLWHGSLRNITLLHTVPHQTSATLHWKLFTPQAVHKPYFCYITVTDQEIPTFVVCFSSLLACAIVSIISFMKVIQESAYEIPLQMFQWALKMH